MTDQGYSWNFGPNAFGGSVRPASEEPSTTPTPVFFPFPNPLEPTPTTRRTRPTRTRTRQRTRVTDKATSSPTDLGAFSTSDGSNAMLSSETQPAATQTSANNSPATQSLAAQPHDSDGSGVSGGVIAAAVVVPIVVLAALGALLFFLLRRRKRRQAAQSTEEPRSPRGPQMESRQMQDSPPRLPPLGVSRKPVPYNANYGPNFGLADGYSVETSRRSTQPDLHMGDKDYLEKPPHLAVVDGRYVDRNGSDRDPFDDPETPASRLTEPFATGSQVALPNATPLQQSTTIPSQPANVDVQRDEGKTNDDDNVSDVSDVSYQADEEPQEAAVVHTAQRASVIKLNGTHSAHSSRGSNASQHSQEGSPTGQAPSVPLQ